MIYVKFNKFKQYYLLIYGSDALYNIKDDFLNWFIGFTEGDGSFIISKTKNNFFYHFYAFSLISFSQNR